MSSKIAHYLSQHPFDTPHGHALLESWLTNSDPEEFSFAVSAAASLPFIGEAGVRNALAALAMDHAEPQVQLEAGWASAFRGSEAGLKFLARMAADVRFNVTAQAYLEELDRLDLLPNAARNPDFQAMAEMCNWLAHPNEFGEPPAEIKLRDKRTIDWPPTNDIRPVWLFEYRYADRNEDGTDEIGVGMVGSVTFALFGETNADLSPEDVYGLHCCWELECNGDERAPRKRSAAAGRKLLGF